MGVEQCPTHGRQTGLLCCQHVQAATRRDFDIEALGAVAFEVDLTDDGRHVLPHIVCSRCAQDYGLHARSRVSGRTAEIPGGFPMVMPTCTSCVDVWLRSVSAGGGDV
jgi:hypothetical protein